VEVDREPEGGITVPCHAYYCTTVLVQYVKQKFEQATSLTTTENLRENHIFRGLPDLLTAFLLQGFYNSFVPPQRAGFAH
jgi:hypothetical protein